MRRTLRTSSCAVLLSALALSACSGSSEPKSITIPFKSPAIVGAALPALYTCDGKDISPPMEWGAVPPATRELAVFILGLTPYGTKGGYTTSVEWSIAGLNPALHRLAAGHLPPGAHAGVTVVGKGKHKGFSKPKRYSICPAKGAAKRYQFALYAIPPTLAIAPKFVGIQVLEAIADPESRYRSYAGGAFVASYKRA
jgi:phosphatidylethanolamine-binding protein (PEBP) family uncharacterized protein